MLHMLPKLTRTSTMGCITGSWIIRKEPFPEFAEVSVATIYLKFPLLCVQIVKTVDVPFDHSSIQTHFCHDVDDLNCLILIVQVGRGQN